MGAWNYGCLLYTSFDTIHANIVRIKEKGEKVWKIVKLSKWKKKYRQNF